ncbi:hypothetical protein QD460_19140 [Rhizobium jaguaris]
MMSEENNSTQLSALAILGVRFPDDVTRVQQLINIDETFRSMCEDLAAAVETLAHVDRLPESVRETRRQEYADLVEALVNEIHDAIRRSNVVVLRRPVDRPKS